MKIYIIIFSILSFKGVAQSDTILFQNQEFFIYKDSANFNGKELYNAKKDLALLIKEEGTNDCSVAYEFYYNPLSLIGNYYSYEFGESGSLACGVPGNSVSIKTINLETNTAVSLTDIFSEESILEALKEDNWIKERGKQFNVNFQSITSFEVFVENINNLNYAQFKLSSFAVMGYNKEKGEVAVRFVGEEYMGYNHNKHLQLGLWLKPNQAFKQLIKAQTHFTLTHFKNGLIK